MVCGVVDGEGVVGLSGRDVKAKGAEMVDMRFPKAE
jgi:hypothetical protein